MRYSEKHLTKHRLGENQQKLHMRVTSAHILINYALLCSQISTIGHTRL